MKFSDQLKRQLEILTFPPKRIISLVPSQTELLSDLGLDEEVIGITKFCVRPAHWFHTKTRIGGTKKINLSLIRSLHPDLIIANKEENLQQEVEALAKDFPVWISDVRNLEDSYEMIKVIGELVGKQDTAAELIEKIKSNFRSIFSQTENSNHELRTAYLIWKDPLMTIGGDTFISNMMTICGFENIFQGEHRYPEVSLGQLSTVNCQLLLLASEPFPFKQKHIEELQQILPETKIILVDGEMFSWYGSRLLHAPAYFSKLRQLVFNA